MSASRSHLYVPADRVDVVRAAGSRGADVLILDLEDAVALARKAEAREIVRSALEAGIEGARDVWVRINAPSFDHGSQLVADLEAAVRAGCAGLIIAKVESVEEVESVCVELQRLEHERAVGSPLGVAALVESAAGLFACEQIARHRRITRIQIGEADLVANLGLEVSDDELELLPVRHLVVAAAAAAAIEPPVGPVSTVITDLDRLRETTLRLRRLGFVGRAVIHPAQIAVVHEIFTPSEAQLDDARRLIDAFARAQRDGVGVFVDERGRMVDEAVVRSARRLLGLPGSTGR